MPAGVITRSNHPDALWPGVKAWFGLNYESYKPQWSQVFTKTQSDKFQERFSEATGFGLAAIKPEGDAAIFDADAQGYTQTMTHVVYALGYKVTREEIEDNQYAELANKRSAMLAKSLNTTAEYVHFNVFNNGFSTPYPIGDGQPFFSASHPTLSGVQSNLLTAADLSEAALEDASKKVFRMQNNRGLPVMADIKRLIINPEDTFNSERILNSILRSGTNNNDINAMRALGTVPEVVRCLYLTDTVGWFIQTDVEEGLISAWRRQVELEKYNDVDGTQNASALASMRFTCGVADWRAAFGNVGV